MILISKYIVPRGYVGITIFPFVFLKQKDMKANAILINHESIHLRQQLELLVLPFYIIYSIEFCFNWIKYRNVNKAYNNISFEKAKKIQLS